MCLVTSPSKYPRPKTLLLAFDKDVPTRNFSAPSRPAPEAQQTKHDRVDATRIRPCAIVTSSTTTSCHNCTFSTNVDVTHNFTMGSNPLSTLMHRMTVSSKDKSKNSDKMTSGAAKKSATVVKRGERQATSGAHTTLRSQSKKRSSGGEEELNLSEEDELVMVGPEYDQRNAAALQQNGTAHQPKKRRSKVQFQGGIEIPKLEEDERKDSALDVAVKRKFSM